MAKPDSQGVAGRSQEVEHAAVESFLNDAVVYLGAPWLDQDNECLATGSRHLSVFSTSGRRKEAVDLIFDFLWTSSLSRACRVR
jgi:hypothetical protein